MHLDNEQSILQLGHCTDAGDTTLVSDKIQDQKTNIRNFCLEANSSAFHLSWFLKTKGTSEDWETTYFRSKVVYKRRRSWSQTVNVKCGVLQDLSKSARAGQEPSRRFLRYFL